MLCDVNIAYDLFCNFKDWYFKTYPDFEGIVRWSAKNLWIAEIIDRNQNLKKFRFARC